MRYRDLPIARKALALGVVPTVGALVLVTLAMGVAVYGTLRLNLTQSGEALVSVVADTMSAPLGFNDAATAAELLRAFRNVNTVDAICVYDSAGREFASYTTATARCPPSDLAPSGTPGRDFQRAIAVGPRRVGSVHLVANTRPLEERLGMLAVIAVATLLIAVALVWVVADRMQRAISVPIASLAAMADRVSATGDYSLRAARTAADETGRLAAAFNGMLTQIERQDRVKDEFLATLSHELRTPLNAILGWLQIIQKTSPAGAALDRAIISVERNARTQQRVVEDLLDISRIVTGKLQMTLAVLDLRLVVTAATDAVATMAADKRIAMSWTTPDRAALVSGDTARLQQAIVNVLANAVKFTREDGHVTVRMLTVGRMYTVSVCDNGIGIDRAFLPHVFERFQQADSSSTREHSGLGLGLAIVQEIVSTHGGTVTAESAGRDQGATFTITLPQLVEEQ